MGNETTEEFRRGFEAARNAAEAVMQVRKGQDKPHEKPGLEAAMNLVAKIATPTEFV